MNAIRIAVAAALIVGAAQVHAQETATGTLNVSATVSDACVVGTSAMTFGDVSGLALVSDVDATGNIEVTCSSDTGYAIALDLGANADEDERRMAGDGNFLSYELFADSARSEIWNDVNTPSDTGTGTTQTHTVYGRILGGQQAAPVGAYSDTVGITVSY